MTNTIITSDMSITEAEACVSAIHAKTAELKSLVYDLWSRRGWLVLGYSSFHACVTDRFGERNASTYYRLKDVANFERNVLPNGETVRHSHVREFAKLNDHDKQFEAFQTAKNIAIAQGDRVITAQHAQQAVQIVLARQAVIESSHRVVSQMMLSGELSPIAAVKFVRALDALPPSHQIEVQSLMATHGLANPDLLPAIVDMLQRDGKPNASLVLPEIRMGYLGGKPLAHASLTDLQNANHEARLQHIADADEQKRQQAIERGEPLPEPVIVTVWKNDSQKTMLALYNALGDVAFNRLFQTMLERAVDTLRK